MNYKRIYQILVYLFLFLLPVVSSCKEEKAMKMNSPRNIRGVTSYARTFGDKNDVHLVAAKRLGISAIESFEEAEEMKKKLTCIDNHTCYVVDSLTHSVPFLVPAASKLLEDISTNFLDSLEAKGLNPNQVIVTSVLRTKDDVRRLRKRNINASENSAHMYGTTFDISYKRFSKVEGKQPMQDVATDTLKLVLAEVLRDLKKEERCYVKYELKQACFHITVR